jgi:hypothetical protein
MRADPQLRPSRVELRLEHLMTEIATPALAPGRHAVERRSRRWVGAVTVAAVASAVAAAVVLVGTTPASIKGATAFAIEPAANGFVAVKVVSTDASARQMTAQLHAAGLNVNVGTEPASPQLVGTWVGASFSANVPAALAKSIASQTDGYAATLDIPKGMTGKVTLYVGVATPSGQQPQVAGLRNALAPGGRLACPQLSGTDPASAKATLAAKGFVVTWKDNISPTAPALAEPAAGAKVTTAFISDTDPNQAMVIAVAPTDRRYAGLIHLGYPLDNRTTDGVTQTSC